MIFGKSVIINLMPRYLLILPAVLVFSAFGGSAFAAASLTLSPSTGTFEVGSTFTVSMFLDSQDEDINALEVILRFPPDKLQLVSPSFGKSIIEVWTGQPTYDNQKGEIHLMGGIPGGIKVEKGLITTLTFRARTTGEAIVRFGDNSKVLANDGKGTDVLGNTQGGFYTLVLPPPAGPIVASETHPDQNKWYSNPTAVLTWGTAEQVEEYSYILNELPIDIPDDISEGTRQTVAFRDLKSGNHYFHIKALREGVWGGTTHFAVNVDIDPPAKFPIKISPGPITTSKTVLINYQTTDIHSGVDHYEYAVIPLQPQENSAAVGGAYGAKQAIFVEGDSPRQLTLDYGKYDVIVRAFDKAGNVQEVTQRLRITNLPLLLLLENPLYWLALLVITVVLIWLGWRSRKWYHHVVLRHERKELPAEVEQQLRELREYRKKYGEIHIFLIACGFSLLTLLGAAHPTAAQVAEVSPPVVTTVSRNISNDEIFYVGGKTDGGNLPVIIYLQNLQTGETTSRTVTSDNKGSWFYRHDAFLSSGRYLLWVQEKVGDTLSPPSPQIELTVQQTALQLGASRISLETLYLILALILLAVNVSSLGYIAVHVRLARKRHAAWLKEVHEAEQSVRRGFAVLKRDIERELELIHKAKLSKELSAEEKQREAQLLKDLQWAEQYIGKEIWDIEETGEPH